MLPVPVPSGEQVITEVTFNNDTLNYALSCTDQADSLVQIVIPLNVKVDLTIVQEPAVVKQQCLAILTNRSDNHTMGYKAATVF